MFKKTALSIIAIITAGLIAGCADSGNSPKTSGVRMALSTTDLDGNQWCVVGTIEIRDSVTNAIVATIDTDCDDAAHEVILLPGSYTVTMDAAPPYTCSATDTNDTTLPGYTSCTYVPMTQPFVVSVGAIEEVPLAFTFYFQNNEDQNVLFGVGSANITIAPPTTQERCGTGTAAPICMANEVCANVDGAGYACHLNCSDMVDPDGAGGAAPVANAATCTAPEVCTPVGRNAVDLLATDPAAFPVPLLINSEGHLADTLHLCGPAPVAAGGAGGALP